MTPLPALFILFATAAAVSEGQDGATVSMSIGSGASLNANGPSDRLMRREKHKRSSEARTDEGEAPAGAGDGEGDAAPDLGSSPPAAAGDQTNNDNDVTPEPTTPMMGGPAPPPAPLNIPPGRPVYPSRGGPSVDTSGRKSKTMLSVMIQGASGRQLIVDDQKTLRFSHTQGSGARWNFLDSGEDKGLLDNGENRGHIYVQSASDSTSNYLYDTVGGVVLQMGPASWELESTDDGHVKIKSAVINANAAHNYLRESGDSLGISTDGTEDDCKFKVTVIATGWGRSPSEAPVPVAVKVFLQGVSGKNLKEEAGAISMGDGWTDEFLWTVLDSGDSRSLMLGSTHGYLKDNGGTLESSVWNMGAAADHDKEWWLTQEEGGTMSLEGNRGHYLVDKEGEAAMSVSNALYDIGHTRRFNLILKSVAFQLAA